MARRRRAKAAKSPKPSEAKVVNGSTGFKTTDYDLMKQLAAAGIEAVNTFGQPMVFEYASEDNARIKAVVGK